MAVVTFDTLNYAKKLEKSGFSEEQAEALAYLQKEVFNEALESQLATKKDTWQIQSELKLHRWMLGILILGVISLIIKAFFVS